MQLQRLMIHKPLMIPPPPPRPPMRQLYHLTLRATLKNRQPLAVSVLLHVLGDQMDYHVISAMCMPLYFAHRRGMTLRKLFTATIVVT